MFFRAGTIEEAKKMGVVGLVENTSKGTVTGEVQGEPKPVSQMKVGPIATSGTRDCSLFMCTDVSDQRLLFTGLATTQGSFWCQD